MGLLSNIDSFYLIRPYYSKMVDEERVEIVETGKIPSGSIALLAFPGVGMSGNIALTQVIDKHGLVEVGHIKSPETPHVVLVHKNRPAYPIRIYYNKGMIAILSELPVLSQAADELNDALIKWIKEKKIKRLYLLGGFPNPQRPKEKKSQVYAIPAGKSSNALVKKYNFKEIKEGAVFGEEGLLLLAAMEEKIPALYLMADAFLSFPDPDSAAAIIEALNKILGKKMDTKELKARGEEIRKRFNTLMEQTNELISKTKPTEREIAPIYR